MPQTPSTRSAVSILGTPDQPTYPVNRRTARELEAQYNRTIIEMAGVRSRGMVRIEQLHQVDRLGREAMTGQAFLHKWNATLAAGDPFIADDLKFFTDVTKLGKGEIIADTVSDFCQGGRR